MTDKIVDFSARRATPPDEPKKELVWQCGHCAHQKFFLHEDGRLECTSCGSFDLPGHWHESRVVDPATDPGFARESTDYGVPELAKAAVLKRGKAPDINLVVVIATEPGEEEPYFNAWWGAEDQTSPDAVARVDFALARVRSALLPTAKKEDKK